MLDLDPNREGVIPVPAATVIIGRPAPGEEPGVEVFCVKRHHKSGFLGGAIVFPGGKVDAGDLSADWRSSLTPLAARAEALGEAALGFAVAALRETLEEAAILPVVGDSLSASDALELRAELARRGKESDVPAGDIFRTLIQARGWVLDTARLTPLWRWTTPKAEKRRFETPFYWLDLPAGQIGESDQHETTQGFWSTPGRLLERWAAGEVFLAPPTSRSLELLAELSSPAEVASLAERHSLDAICPELVFEGEATILALPGDPLHSRAEPIGGSEEGPTRFVLESGRFVGKHVPRGA
ncbi:MAG: hypothetical protein H6718_00980 [Polyangiaceae bacterium]|nr:hypothetical protein [Myxococcales bacterium]MCB9583935.1 hypothetical protein [Polyangiaceae bacterium]MCB9607809.1 hypothetical protein [Polyangiaceae bacterium]